MIALDTNVLVRFLVEDDKKQAAKASRLIETAISEGQELFVADVVLCELVWVLSRSYKVQRSVIVETLQQLLRAGHLAFRDEDVLHRAINRFAKGKGDFADYVIAFAADAEGFSQVATSDKALLKEERFVSP